MIKTKFYFINKAENILYEDFKFGSLDLDFIKITLNLFNEPYEDISWEELKEELINYGWKYCYWNDKIVTDEYAKEIGLIYDYKN